MNRFSLVIFLGANLATGAVNSSIKTLYTPALPSLCILVAYGCMLAGMAWGCEWVSRRRSEGKKRDRERS
jgi:hypothetical protein